MFKLSKSHILLLSIVAFSFGYRLMLLLWDTYPPGADPGLHNSVIHSIIDSGGATFVWNNYHMGAGVSVTFPGYHIFVSYIILLTGMPDYLAHALVVSLFSSLIVVAAYLITRKVWNASAALIVAFLAAFSQTDIEMLMWGGYPNVVALALIPLAFYIFLQRDKLSLSNFLAVASLLSGAIFLTHNFSALVFVGIMVCAVVFLMLFSKRFAVGKKQVLLWLLPLALGAIIVSPYLLEVAPLMLGSDAVFGGASADVRLAFMSTQTMTLDFVYPLLICVFFILAFTRKYRGRFFVIPALLLSFWVLVPAVASQGYLLGYYADYNRFKYFVYLPVIMMTGVAIDFAAGFLVKKANSGLSKAQRWSRIKDRGRRILQRMHPGKLAYAILAVGFVFLALSSMFIFALPAKSIEMENYYNVVDPPLYDALMWARNSTPENAVFASDKIYGWWIAGFAQRQTLSAQDPQFLVLAREFEPAKNVKNLLDTDYILDNGLLHVKEDGGYLARNNPLISARLNDSYYPYEFFRFNSDETKLSCRVDGIAREYALSELSVKEMRSENTSDYAAVIVARGNEFFTLTETTTIYRGLRFANISITIESLRDGVQIDWATIALHVAPSQRFTGENTLAFMTPSSNICGQLVFTSKQPQVQSDEGNPVSFGLKYQLGGNSNMIELFAGAFRVSAASSDEQSLLNNADHYADKVADYALDVFDYRSFLLAWDVSYVACRDAVAVDRFVDDPFFSVAFVNDEVTFFRVNTVS